MADKQKRKRKKEKPEQKPWKNRIIGHGEAVPSELVANDRNWRLHPASQRQIFDAAVDDIGFIRSIIVNNRTGRIIDGHLRLKSALDRKQPTITVEYVDLSEAEELKALATIDPIAALAETDEAELKSLIRETNFADQGISDMLAALVAEDESPDPEPETQNVENQDKGPAVNRYEIVIECRDEDDQRALFVRMEEEGRSVRATIRSF